MSHAETVMSLLQQAYRMPDTSRQGDVNIHASNLIDFCPRTYYLCKTNDRALHGSRYHSMGEHWTFDIGHAYQKILISRLMTQQVIFGAWKCRHCGKFEVGLQQDVRVCPHCKCKAWEFKDLRIELPIQLNTKPKSQIIVVGHIDHVIATSPAWGFIVDDKSIKAKGCPKCPGEDFDSLKMPSVSYQRQVRIYMWMSNHKDKKIVGNPRNPEHLAKFKIDPKHAVILYACKGARQMPFKTFLVEQDMAFIKTIEIKLQALAKSIETKTIPPQICGSQSDLMAKQCVARDICFGQQLGKRKG